MCNLIFRCLLTFINWRQSDRLIGPQEAWRSGGLAGARRAWSSVDAHAALHQQAASAGLSSAGDSWTCGLLVKGARSAATSSIFKETIEKGLLFFFSRLICTSTPELLCFCLFFYVCTFWNSFFFF